ncbi:ATPase [Spirochaetia bacterium]|nr:ATPase [Spirochaetia bacterium]
MIQRPDYLAKLEKFKDKELIKIITGIRRCGKSTLLYLFREQLSAAGTAPEQMIVMNLEDPENRNFLSWEALYDHVAARLLPDRINYVFLDEVQLVPDFQRAAIGLFNKKNVDLYITGSNAFLLSGELATLLAGRYIEISMLPLSFKEFLSAFESPAIEKPKIERSVMTSPQQDLSRRYQDYITNSSFPYTLKLRGSTAQVSEEIQAYLGGIYNTIVLKDIMERRKFADPLMLESVIRFMFDNIGNLSSTQKISNTLNSAGRKISVNTVENYLSALTASFILYRLGRFDIKGKQLLKTGDKYYLADPALRLYLLGREAADYGRVLENIVFLELLRRGKRLAIGKLGDQEIDFVAESPRQTGYYQVALSVRDDATLERELRPLLAIRDHHPKWILTLDDDPSASYQGIQRLNVLDWLLTDE